MRGDETWSMEKIERFLDETRVPLRLACNGTKGYPVLASLWFVPIDGKLWCATQKSAAVAAHLERDFRCAFEVAQDSPSYRGVRGQAVANLHQDRGESVLRVLIDRYLGGADTEFSRWLMERAVHETAIAITPRTLRSWDYSHRMRDEI